MTRLLFKVLGLALRLIVFAITGEWLSAPDPAAEASGSTPPPAMPSDEVAAAPVRRKASRGARLGPEQMGRPASAMLADADMRLTALAAPVREPSRRTDAAQGPSRPIWGQGTIGGASSASPHVAARARGGEAASVATALRNPRSVREALVLANAIARGAEDAVPGHEPTRA